MLSVRENEYQKLIEHFNNDNPDGDGFYLDTDQFSLEMDKCIDECGVNYYCIYAEDTCKCITTMIDIYNEDTVYIRSSIGNLLLDQNRLHFLFKIINTKIEQMRDTMLKNIQNHMNS